MKQKEIIEGNKLIAEFMGWEFGLFEHLPNRCHKIENGNRVGMYIENAAYHTSYDWLMSVVEKIGEIHNQADKELLESIENANLPMFNTSIFCHREELYKRVAQFIQWYNSNHPSK